MFFSCSHEKWIAKIVPLSNKRLSLREFCIQCGSTFSGSRLGYALPMIADAEIVVPSFKHANKTLGEIAKIDRPYLKWLVIESKTSDRVRKAAARLYCSMAYTPPKEGESYEKARCYDPAIGWFCIQEIKNER